MSARDIFKGETPGFVTYAAELQVTGVLVGGIPKDPETIRGWLKSRLDLGDRELVDLARQTESEMLETEGRRATADELLDAVTREVEGGNGFKSIEGQLVYEGRCLKAGLKEGANVAFPGTDFPGKQNMPKTFKKGLMSALAERVFVTDDFLALGCSTPSRTEQRIKHVKTPQGPRSAINVVDVVDKPRIAATVAVWDDFLPPSVWARIWGVLEHIGIGSDRARGDGKFTLERWERID